MEHVVNLLHMHSSSGSQVTASVCELIMPYFYSKIICSISQQGCQEAFREHLTSYAAFALGFAVLAAGRGALFGVINNKLSRALRYMEPRKETLQSAMLSLAWMCLHAANLFAHLGVRVYLETEEPAQQQQHHGQCGRGSNNPGA